MLFLATTVIQKTAEFQQTITQFFLEYNPVTKTLETSSRELFQLPFGILVPSFLLISALAHVIIYLKSEKCLSDIGKGINKFRWFDYAISSSIMIDLISTLFGIYDIASLI